MPAPIDLSGRVIGCLTIIKKTGVTSGNRKYPVWLCECQCGRYEEIPQLYLPYCSSNAARRGARYSCYTCMKGPCGFCGGPITRKTNTSCCSERCQTELKRQKYRENYYRRVEQDPEYNLKKAAVNRERKNTDPEYAAKAKLWEQRQIKKRSERLQSDPDYAESQRQRGRDWYQKNRAAKLAQNRMNYFATPIEQRRKYWRDYAARRRAEIASDPVRHAEQLAYQRVKGREHWQRKKKEQAIADFRSLFSQLQELNEDNDE